MDKQPKKYIKMKLPEGPLIGSKESLERGYCIAQPGYEFMVEDLFEDTDGTIKKITEIGTSNA